jgi:signal transduction histidine kinase
MLIERVLQLSLFEQKKSPLQFTDIHINELLEDIAHNFSFKVEKNKGKIFTHFDAYNDIALIDEVHFTNVIYNLLDNALKYSNPPLLLHIRTRNVKEEELIIEVEDNGIGIAEKDLKLIFDKFYRVSTENVHNVNGFGIGLAYVTKMISEHQGRIQVISELNIGTKFIITIPTLKND